MLKLKKLFGSVFALAMILILVCTAVAATETCNHENFYSHERIRCECIDNDTHSVIVEVVARCPDCRSDINVTPFETYTELHTIGLTDNRL